MKVACCSNYYSWDNDVTRSHDILTLLLLLLLDTLVFLFCLILYSYSYMKVACCWYGPDAIIIDWADLLVMTSQRHVFLVNFIASIWSVPDARLIRVIRFAHNKMMMWPNHGSWNWQNLPKTKTPGSVGNENSMTTENDDIENVVQLRRKYFQDPIFAYYNINS